MIDTGIVFLPCEDLHAIDHFYVGLLGLRLRLDQGSCRIYEICPGACIGFCTGLEHITPCKAVIITLVRNDVELFYDFVLNKGAEVDGPPRHNKMFQIVHFFIRDPNGYRVEVQRFEDQRW